MIVVTPSRRSPESKADPCSSENLQCLEVARGNGRILNERRQLSRLYRMSLDLERGAGRTLRNRQLGRRARRLDCGQGGQSIDELLREAHDFRRLRVGGRRKRDAERQRVACHEPRLGRHQAREAPREQPRSHEEDQGHRRLRDDQEVAAAVTAGMIGCAPSAVTQAGQHVGSRVPDRGTKTEDQRGDRRSSGRHEEHPPIDADLVEPRHGIGREPKQGG
jgi:hypothetical protein